MTLPSCAANREICGQLSSEKQGYTSLAEQILQILPIDVKRELSSGCQHFLHRNMPKQWEEQTLET